MNDLDDLRRKAEAATPGPWDATTSEATMNDFSAYRFGSRSRPAAFLASQMRYADAEFIAAANPAAVIDLLDRIEVLEDDLLLSVPSTLLEQLIDEDWLTA